MSKKLAWLFLLLGMVTAVSLACQLATIPLPNTNNATEVEFPEFIQPEKGFTRSIPLPVGEPIVTQNWTVEVLELSRGQDAWQQLKTVSYGNNTPPTIGEEYVLLKMRVTHQNEKGTEESLGISLTGSAGVRYYSFNSDLSVPIPYLNTTNLAGGESEEGWYAFVIAEEETDLLLLVDEYATYDEPLTYAALEEGASILVDDTLTIIEPTNRGRSIQEPAPFGSTVINENWELTVMDVIIGDEAWDILLETNRFNDPPTNDVAYVLLKLKVRYIGQGDTPADMSGYRLQLLNASGELYDTPSLVEPRPRFDFNMYPGAEAEGWLALAVPKSDPTFMLRFNPEYGEDNPDIRYLSLDATGR